MSSPIPPQNNDVPDIVRYLLDFIIYSGVNLHSENNDKSPIIPSPLSTAATAVTIAINVNIATDALSSQDSIFSVSTVRVGNDENKRATRRSFEIPAHVPMSEEIGEKVFLQGYDSNRILPCYYPETYMQLLDNYSSIPI